LVVIECEKIDNLTDPNLRIAVLSRQVGGEIMFSCMQGFGLDGPTHSTCLPTGEWEQPFPTCAGIYKYILDFTRYIIIITIAKLGEAIAFLRVLSDFEKLIPSPLSQYSLHPVFISGPKCNWYVVAVTCPWPGDPPHGYAAVSQNSYRPGEHVSISCEPYYVLDGQPKLVCGDNGEWSSPMPICKWDG